MHPNLTFKKLVIWNHICQSIWAEDLIKRTKVKSILLWSIFTLSTLITFYVNYVLILYLRFKLRVVSILLVHFTFNFHFFPLCCLLCTWMFRLHSCPVYSLVLFDSKLWFFQWSCMDVRVELWRKLSAEELMLLNCGVGEDSWESLGLQEDPTSPS